MKNKNWRELVAACRSSEKSITAWCKEQGIACSTYHNWVKKLATEEPQQWAEIKTTTARVISTEEAKLSYCKWAIAVSEGFDAKLLAEILMVVDAVC